MTKAELTQTAISWLDLAVQALDASCLEQERSKVFARMGLALREGDIPQALADLEGVIQIPEAFRSEQFIVPCDVEMLRQEISDRHRVSVEDWARCCVTCEFAIRSVYELRLADERGRNKAIVAPPSPDRLSELMKAFMDDLTRPPKLGELR